MNWPTPNPYIIDVRNVHTALPRAINILLAEGRGANSRNGTVFTIDHPVITVYRNPWERVLFWHERDANPFFHFMEGLLFLAGDYQVANFTLYAKQLAEYSDDGKTLPASYGHRWRTYFDRDQLSWAIGRLRNDPADRRVVISMWDPREDPVVADNGGKDVPCNTNMFLGIRNGGLDMMVNCRSNDIFWGAYGANAVHMSMVQEYLARSIGVYTGRCYQNSFNWHAYSAFYKTVMNDRPAADPEQSLRKAVENTLSAEAIWDPYASGEFGLRGVVPMMDQNTHSRRADFATWDRELEIFLDGGSTQADGLQDSFFTTVAAPIRDAHVAYRNKDYGSAHEIVSQCAALDWRKGCQDWLSRRAEQRSAKPAL